MSKNNLINACRGQARYPRRSSVQHKRSGRRNNLCYYKRKNSDFGLKLRSKEKHQAVVCGLSSAAQGQGRSFPSSSEVKSEEGSDNLYGGTIGIGLILNS